MYIYLALCIVQIQYEISDINDNADININNGA